MRIINIRFKPSSLDRNPWAQKQSAGCGPARQYFDPLAGYSTHFPKEEARHAVFVRWLGRVSRVSVSVSAAVHRKKFRQGIRASWRNRPSGIRPGIDKTGVTTRQRPRVLSGHARRLWPARLTPQVVGPSLWASNLRIRFSWRFPVIPIRRTINPIAYHRDRRSETLRSGLRVDTFPDRSPERRLDKASPSYMSRAIRLVHRSGRTHQLGSGRLTIFRHTAEVSFC